MSASRRCIAIMGVAAAVFAPRVCRVQAATAVGDAGHYLGWHTRVFLDNPDGRSFDVTVHRFPWWIGAGWNVKTLPVRITAPDGTVVFEQDCLVPDGGYAIVVNDAQAGPYRVDVTPNSGLNFWYVTASLDRSVAWTGPPDEGSYQVPVFQANPFVPRKWYFWVPGHTRRFIVRAQSDRGRSQREDHGLTLYSPRGQRMAVLWGQPNPDLPTENIHPPRRVQTADILVEPGAAGRFWSIDVRMGDSHTYSDINFTLEGVPPYVARSPEEWFHPEQRHMPRIPVYDESFFMQSDRSPDAPNRQWQHWTPCPALGDPDACEIRGDTRFALWNPAGREFKFVIGTYLPRNMFPGVDPETSRWRHLADAEHPQADIRMTGPDGGILMDERVPLKHQHAEPGVSRMIQSAAGILHVSVRNCEHYLAYTYPAMPTVLLGEPVEDGWQRFRFEAGTARNWYFFVPPGTATVGVRAAAQHAGDVMHLEVNAPDRTLDMLYGNAGQTAVAVPAGLDGKIWHIRIDVGSATRFETRSEPARFPSLNLTLDLQGVPGALAPTWEQWFDPANPHRAHRR